MVICGRLSSLNAFHSCVFIAAWIVAPSHRPIYPLVEKHSPLNRGDRCKTYPIRCLYMPQGGLREAYLNLSLSSACLSIRPSGLFCKDWEFSTHAGVFSELSWTTECDHVGEHLVGWDLKPKKACFSIFSMMYEIEEAEHCNWIKIFIAYKTINWIRSVRIFWSVKGMKNYLLYICAWLRNK